MSDIEIAKRVAEACGWTRHKMFTVYGGGGFGIYLGEDWRTFNPVQRLDDAFFAAEAVGLFEEPEGRLYKANGQWCFDWDGVTSVQYVTAESPARAICLAVLGLKGIPLSEPSP